MENDLRSLWILTQSGRTFHPFDPKIEDVDIFDIAHSLSMQCRYGGHSNKFYSVAEHSLYVSELVTRENALWGLLHDATEAYVTDIPSPLKKGIPLWSTVENNIMRVICEKFNLSSIEPSEVKHIDTLICNDEMKEIMDGVNIIGDFRSREFLNVKINCYDSNMARSLYINRFFDLMENRNNV